jgi:hypothetical protein
MGDPSVVAGKRGSLAANVKSKDAIPLRDVVDESERRMKVLLKSRLSG